MPEEKRDNEKTPEEKVVEILMIIEKLIILKREDLYSTLCYLLRDREPVSDFLCYS